MSAIQAGKHRRLVLVMLPAAVRVQLLQIGFSKNRYIEALPPMILSLKTEPLERRQHLNEVICVYLVMGR